VVFFFFFFTVGGVPGCGVSVVSPLFRVARSALSPKRGFLLPHLRGRRPPSGRWACTPPSAPGPPKRSRPATPHRPQKINADGRSIENAHHPPSDQPANQCGSPAGAPAAGRKGTSSRGASSSSAQVSGRRRRASYPEGSRVGIQPPIHRREPDHQHRRLAWPGATVAAGQEEGLGRQLVAPSGRPDRALS